ncbi:MAG: DUF2061 domain-containing protein [Minwuia sp.]|nr:DUF2061 domain-containing protein [Minwuia sp.]
MDSTIRTLAKTLTWQTSGLIVMMAITYAVTGSLMDGGIVAAISAATGACAYVAHERLWSRVNWGRVVEGSR